MVPAITYFRTFRHYHWPEELNGRVRNGNECFLLGKVTGKRARRRRSRRSVLVYQRGSGIKRTWCTQRGAWRVRDHTSCVFARRLDADRVASRRGSKWSSIRPLVLVS